MDSVAERKGSPTSTPARSSVRPSGDRQLEKWLHRQRDFLSRYWFDEVCHRGSLAPEFEPILRRFLEVLTAMVPEAVGSHQAHVAPLWREAAELYGSMGAQRGLAAGDIVEEFQILREAVIRLFFRAPPARPGGAFSLSDALRLNRFLDAGVTHASIGHTDALFFALLQGSGVPKVPTAELVTDVEEQLRNIKEELSLPRR